MKIIMALRNWILVFAVLTTSLPVAISSGYRTENFRGHFYQKISVPTINTVQKIKAKGSYALLAARQSLNQNAYKKRIASIESQFKKIENNLRAHEKDAVIAILKKYDIDDQDINFCFHVIDGLKKFGTEYMSASQENIFHDETIPAHLYELFIKHLHKNSIHPESINLFNAINNDDCKDAPEDMITASPWPRWSLDEGELTIDKEQPVQYGMIVLLPNSVRNISSEGQEALIAHECKHLKEQHSITCGTVEVCLKNLTTNCNPEELFATKEWKTLKRIHEQQAEIFPCLDDAITALQMRKLRAAQHYTGTLYENHYNQVSSIDELWKQRTWLKTQINETCPNEK
jgi:hypothetical protein